MVIAEQDVWLKAYCAVLTGVISESSVHKGSLNFSQLAIQHADQAVKDFAKRFPAFRFHSEENKE